VPREFGRRNGCEISASYIARREGARSRPPVNLQAAVEALLFSSDQPLTLALLSQSLDTSEASVLDALQTLGTGYAGREAGVELREIAGGGMLVATAARAEGGGGMRGGRRTR